VFRHLEKTSTLRDQLGFAIAFRTNNVKDMFVEIGVHEITTFQKGWRARIDTHTPTHVS
jgi:hypothetical protein